jgi:hypothetical protein
VGRVGMAVDGLPLTAWIESQSSCWV